MIPHSAEDRGRDFRLEQGESCSPENRQVLAAYGEAGKASPDPAEGCSPQYGSDFQLVQVKVSALTVLPPSSKRKEKTAVFT